MAENVVKISGRCTADDIESCVFTIRRVGKAIRAKGYRELAEALEGVVNKLARRKAKVKEEGRLEENLIMPVSSREQLDKIHKAEKALSDVGITFDTHSTLAGGEIVERVWSLDWSLKGAKLKEEAEMGDWFKVKIKVSHPDYPERVKEYDALVDTGSDWGEIPEKDAKELDLPYGGQETLETRAGKVPIRYYYASIEVEGQKQKKTIITANGRPPVLGVRTLEFLKLKVNPVEQKLEPVAWLAMGQSEAIKKESAERYAYRKGYLPKSIEVFSNVIIKHYFDASACQIKSFRVLKDKDVLVYLCCAKGDKMKAGRCHPNPTVHKTITPRSEKYEKALEHLRKVHPEIPVTYHKEEGIEAREPLTQSAPVVGEEHSVNIPLTCPGTQPVTLELEKALKESENAG